MDQRKAHVTKTADASAQAQRERMRAQMHRQEGASRHNEEQIKSDIDRTRSRLDQTIDELHFRLSPSNLANQAVETMKKTGRNAGHNTMSILRNHPFPAAIAGLGIGWLMFSAGRDRWGSSGSPDREDARIRQRNDLYEAGMLDPRYGRPVTPARRPGEAPARESEGRFSSAMHSAQDAAHSAKDRASHAAGSARDKASHLAGQAKHGAESVGHSVAGGASAAADYARSGAHHVAEGAHTAADYARAGASNVAYYTREGGEYAYDHLRSGARWTKGTAKDTFDDHPLSVGLAVFAGGLAAGMFIPTTRREDEWIGPTRDELMREAKMYGRDMLHRGQAVAGAAVDAAGAEAQQQHLTPEDAKQGAKEAAAEVKTSAKAAGEDLKHRAESVVKSGKHAAEDEAEKQNLKK